MVVDLVANHTSDQHPWFKSARADAKSPFRDWYVWSDKRPRTHAQGQCEVLDCDAPSVLVLSYEFRKAAMITLHNFSEAAQTVHLKLKAPGGRKLVDLIADEHSTADRRGTHEIALDGYAYRWFRVGGVDETLVRETY